MSTKSLNLAQIIGHLGADPELRYGSSGMAIASISVATNERYKDPADGEWKERTEWHRFVVFDKLAEIAGEFLKKGSQVYLAGPLQTRSWDDKDGIKRYTTEIKVNNLILLGGKGEGSSTRPPHPADTMEPTHTGAVSPDVKAQVEEEDAKPTF